MTWIDVISDTMLTFDGGGRGVKACLNQPVAMALVNDEPLYTRMLTSVY